MKRLVYRRGSASAAEIQEHLKLCDLDFNPPLSTRVDIGDFSRKIKELAINFEAWSGSHLVGLLSAYLNDRQRGIGFITNVSLVESHRGCGVAAELLTRCQRYARWHRFERLDLEVAESAEVAKKLYLKCGFRIIDTRNGLIRMQYLMEDEMTDTKQRNYDRETKDVAERKYAYGFDFDVMHPFMIRSFEPFFQAGRFLELGSFKGDFTHRLLTYTTDMTCVEASGEAIMEAGARLGPEVCFVQGLLEEVKLDGRYENIIMTHVLEHLDDPIAVLRRVNQDWLTERGRFFLVCPNANAPSRQIAVKMGLIGHNAAVTSAEAEHGHRITYSLDTLERDVRAAGLKVVHRSGIFFKALANFQWDQMLQAGIVGPDYLEGCFQLGQVYPDLCASIFLLCERGP